MSLTRNQTILIGAAAVLVLLIGGVLLFGLQGSNKAPKVSLVIWGVENRNDINDFLYSYQTDHSNVQFKYVEMNPDTYEQDLLNALAAGNGPDILMFKNTWLPKHFDKLTPVADAKFNLTQLRQFFPTVVEQDFAPDKIIYALPIYIDTLALYTNQSILESAGVALAPTTWLNFQNLIPQLRKMDSAKNISRAAAALGGSQQSVDNAADILSLLMLQAGTEMTNSDFSRATFATPIGDIHPGQDALDFYTQFSDKTNRFYTWNESLGNSLNAFAQGKAAMMLNYGEKQKALKDLNPFLKFSIAPMPQPTLTDPAVNYASYWGLAVSNQSKNPDWAWDMIIYLATNEPALGSYLQKTGRSPALRTLIQKDINDSAIGVFAKQALTARSWPQIDEKFVADTFSQMISSVVNGQLDSKTALAQAEKSISDLMAAKKQ